MKIHILFLVIKDSFKRKIKEYLKFKILKIESLLRLLNRYSDEHLYFHRFTRFI